MSWIESSFAVVSEMWWYGWTVLPGCSYLMVVCVFCVGLELGDGAISFCVD